MALELNALTTLATAKDELGSTANDAATNARIERYINAASSIFERLTNTQWYYSAAAVERVPGWGDPVLELRQHLPILSVSEIRWDDGETSEVVDADDYRVVRPDLGEIELIKGRWTDTRLWRQDIVAHRVSGSDEPNYRVTYEGGYVTPEQARIDGSLTRTLPYDVEEAVLDYVAMLWSRRGQDLTVKSKSLGSFKVTYIDGVEMPPSFAAAIKTHKLFEVS